MTTIIILVIIVLLSPLLPTNDATDTDQQQHQQQKHDKNVAILLSSSTFFHNYRHTTNTLALYQSLKKYGGYNDEHILLFLGDEVACNARNPFPNTVFPYGSNDNSNNDEGIDKDNIWNGVQVDYSGSDVTIENFFRALLGRHAKGTPSHQKLPLSPLSSSQTDERVNLFIYMTGHGGDQFFKFRDTEVMTTQDLRFKMEELQITSRFHKVLFIFDTCQAFTLAPNTVELQGLGNNDNDVDDDDNNNHDNGRIMVRNVYSIGTSLKDESSYGHHGDRKIGHSVMDRYMYYFLEYMGGLNAAADNTHVQQDSDESSSIANWFQMEDITLKEGLIDSMYYYNRHGDAYAKKLGVDVGYSDLGCHLKMEEIPMSDFFIMKQGMQRFNENIGHEEEEEDGSADDDNIVTLIMDQVDFWKSAD